MDKLKSKYGSVRKWGSTVRASILTVIGNGDPKILGFNHYLWRCNHLGQTAGIGGEQN